jgi:hypothetical protein
MKKFFVFIMCIVMIAVASSCSSKKSVSTSNSAVPQSANGGIGVESKLASDVAKTEEVADAKDSESKPEMISDGRKVIYNASITLDVRDLNKTYDSIISKAGEISGFVSHSSISGNSSTIVVRIPSSQMEYFIKYIDTLGGQNKESSIDTEDVTEKYYDAQSNLRNLKAQEEQYLTILKKANTIEEIMKVQDEIYRVRGEIETLQGRINMWDNLIDLCTITIRLNKIVDIKTKDVGISYITWAEFTRAMSNGFKSTLNFIIRLVSNLFILLVSIIPLLPFIGAAVWLLLKYKNKINIIKRK